MASFYVEKRSSVVLVKPSRPTPEETLSLSTIDNDLNMEVLCHAIYAYQPNHHHHPDVDPFTLFQQALSDLLVFFYPLAGKLKRHAAENRQLRLNCNSTGVPFVAATADCTLSSINYLEGLDINTLLHRFTYDYNPSADQSEDGHHPLVLQVTKFTCGGLTVAMGLSHAVCDGFGAALFFRSLTEMAAGKEEPSIKPVWERERLTWKNPAPKINDDDRNNAHEVKHINGDQFNGVVAKSPYLPSNDLVHQFFYVDGENLKNLKLQLMKELAEVEKQIMVTTVEALGAYVWRARARALRLDPAGKTYLCFPVGIRLRLNPPLPQGYYGNGFLTAKTEMTVKELDEAGSLARAIKLIKESKRIDCSDESLNESLRELEMARESGEKIDGTGAYTMLTDWRQLGLQDGVDFGYGDSVNFKTLPCPIFGYVDLCTFLPPCKLDGAMGGVRVLVSLPRQALPKFQHEIDGLKNLRPHHE